MKDAHEHYVAAELAPSVDRIAYSHGGIREVIPGGDEIHVDYMDGTTVCFRGPDDHHVIRKAPTAPTYDQLVGDHAHLDGPPSDPVDALTVAEWRLDSARTIIADAARWLDHSEAAEREARLAIQFAGKLTLLAAMDVLISD
jgi:hypothetical protein